MSVGGLLGRAIGANQRGRLSTFITGPESKPVAIFSENAVNRNFAGDWNGEHAGKWLYTAARAARRSGDQALLANVRRVADYLVSRQEPSGYLGTYAPTAESRITSPKIAGARTWDLWVHAYNIIGLLEVNRYFPEPRYVDAARRIGDLCFEVIVRRGVSTADMGNHLGLSGTVFLEPALDLYEATGDARFLELARKVVENMETRPALRIVARSLKGDDLQQIGDGKIYQLLWTYVGLAKMSAIENQPDYRAAAEHAWKETAQHHLTPDGGPWGGIAAHHEVFNPRNFWAPDGLVETCNTMSWIHLNRELLRLTGDAKYAEEIEKTAYNALIGAQDPNGEDWYYFSFSNGTRNNTYYWACCKSSGSLALEELAPLLFAARDNGVSVNVYSEGSATIATPAGDVKLIVKTAYPAAGDVRIAVSGPAGASVPLHLRIPAWAAGAAVSVNGARADGEPKPGEWFRLERAWKAGDEVRLTFPMKPRIERKSRIEKQGEQEIVRRDYMALLRGPLVYATGLIDGFKREETVRLPSGNPELLVAPARAPAGADGPALALKPIGRAPIVFVPFYEAGGRANAKWRATWIPVAWQ
ncbi:MAG TPA: hypothetical protein DEH78_24860 [Solibacterales bacterium]|nr:hypothetical protein [Bryobacterales bacterium]